MFMSKLRNVSLILSTTFLTLANALTFSTQVISQSSIVRDRNSRDVALAEKIRRVENGLLPPVFVKGRSRRMNLLERMKFYKVPGVTIAVINDGRIEWAKGYGVKRAGESERVTPETLFQAASISKPVTAIAALHLVQAEALDLDGNVNDKLLSWKVPENQFTTSRKVTLRRLLSHTAGLTVPGFPGYQIDQPLPTLLQILNGEKPANTPPVRVQFPVGEGFRYSGGGTTVVQQLLIDVTKKAFPALMQELVLTKLEMKRSTFEQPLPAKLHTQAAHGHDTEGRTVQGGWYVYPEMAAAGMWTTASDLALLAIEIQKSKVGKSNKILSAEMIDTMLSPQVRGNGLGFGLDGEGRSARFFQSGRNKGYICFMTAYQNTGQGLVVMTNTETGGELIEEIARGVAKEYHWPDYLLEEKVIKQVDPKVFEDYLGEYEFEAEPGVFISISTENGKLFRQVIEPGEAGQIIRGAKAELLPESETHFFLRDIAVQYVFVKDEKGKVTKLILRGRGPDRVLKRK